ncbi:MAG: putative bacteriophage protein [Phenylobacterium sp.]|nr:putative bacteriophage protein [Phenylobacterium sp.]
MKHFLNWEGAPIRGAVAPSPANDLRGKLIAGSRRRFLTDNFVTFDQAAYDSAGAFLIGELERLDPMIHEPLVSTTWDRDIDLRTDVQMGDEHSSYTTSSFGSAGGAAPAGISWAGKATTTLPRAQLDIQKVVNDLTLWAEEVSYTVPELISAQQLGRPIDTQMLSALNLKSNMDIDQLVYVGDAAIGATGLVNHTLVTNTGNVANGSTAAPQWVTKTPDEIVADFNELLISVWAASGYKAPPDKVLVAPNPFGYISTVKVSEAGNVSILSYVQENNIMTAQFKRPLEILPVKWLDKANINGPGGSAATYDRMVAYSQRPEYVRFPFVPLQAMQPQYRGIWVAVPYYGRLGRVELVYPETVGSRDGIG